MRDDDIESDAATEQLSMSAGFDRSGIESFRFVRVDIDLSNGHVELVYAFDDGPELIEQIRVPGGPFSVAAQRRPRLDRALQLLHLIAGISYYKAAVPPKICIDSYSIDAATADFMRMIYEQGLGEFAYRNQLSLQGKISFPAEDGADNSVDNLAQGTDDAEIGHALVAIGGGKDSLVSIEALRAAGVSQTVTWVGGSPLIRACAERTGLPTLNIGRQLAPQLFEYNRQGALNGHIPVTAINSAILAVAAMLRGDSAIVFSNERSASYGSEIPGAGEVNHQWSKSWIFEQAFARELRRRVDPSLRYFSLLRPLSELAVARQFAKLSHYDAHFSSCNRNFHLLGERPASRWCGVCPKCHFVFLALAPFMSKPRLMGIFGRNLLDEPDQAAGFDALIEYRDHKPFECVGEARESRAALAALADNPSWREDALVARFAAEIAPQLNRDALSLSGLLLPEGEHGVPASLWSQIDAHFRA